MYNNLNNKRQKKLALIIKNTMFLIHLKIDHYQQKKLLIQMIDHFQSHKIIMSILELI